MWSLLLGKILSQFIVQCECVFQVLLFKILWGSMLMLNLLNILFCAFCTKFTIVHIYFIQRTPPSFMLEPLWFCVHLGWFLQCLKYVNLACELTTSYRIISLFLWFVSGWILNERRPILMKITTRWTSWRSEFSSTSLSGSYKVKCLELIRVSKDLSCALWDLPAWERRALGDRLLERWGGNFIVYLWVDCWPASL